QNDRMPLGLFLLIARLAILPLLARRDANVRNRFAVRHVPRVRVLAEIPDQDYLIDASAHDVCVSPRSIPRFRYFRQSALPIPVIRPLSFTPLFFASLSCTQM